MLVSSCNKMTMTLTPRKPCKGKPSGGGSSPPPTPTPSATQLAVTAAATSGPVGTSVVITAQLRGTSGPVAIAGVPVIFSTNAGSVSPMTATTDSTGKAQTTLTLSTVAGTSHSVTASTAALTGSVSVSSIPGAATRFEVTVSDLTPEAGSTISVTARLKDAFNNNVSVAGLLATWSKTGTGGAFAAGTSLTNSSGVATQSFTVASDDTVNHTITATSGAITGTSPLIDVQPEPTGVTPDEQDVIDNLGPILPKVDMPPGLAWYDQKVEDYGEAQYNGGTVGADVIPAYGPATAPAGSNTISVYERPASFYAEWVHTGDTKWRDYADAMVLAYLNDWLNPGGVFQVPSPHFSQMESLYMYKVLHGDPDGRLTDAMNRIALAFCAFTADIVNLSKPWLENRVQTRTMIAHWVAEKLFGVGALTGYQDPALNNFTDILDGEILAVLAMQSPDGSWRFPLSTCGESLNYMSGMLADFLTRIYDNRPKTSYNSAILDAMKKLGHFLWDTQWRGVTPGDSQSFNYMSGLCVSSGSATPAPDENAQMAALFMWLGKTTGETTTGDAWWTKGDQVIDGMQGASWYLYRQYSQQIASSYRALGYRYGP